MRPTSVVAFAQTARAASKQFVRIQLKTAVERLGVEGDVVLVRPGYMRNHLLPTSKAVYLPIETSAQRMRKRLEAARLEAKLAKVTKQQEAVQVEEEEREAIVHELGPVQLLSLRTNLQQIPPISLRRITTTKYRGDAEELPNPPLTIQGSISVHDVVDFLREANAFTLDTEFNPEAGSEAPLHRLTNAQVLAACELTLSAAEGVTGGSLDKLNRIKTTGKYELTILLRASNTRVRIPVTVRPASASISHDAPSTPAQTRGYATQAGTSPRMESSMRQKLESEFGPAEIHIRNDSSKHAHHAAMAAQGGGNGETHFYVEVISDKFDGMTQIKRHRAVNALLAREFELGLHALSLRTKTFAEVDKTATRADEKRPTGGSAEEIEERGGSLWTAPESTLYPTAPRDLPTREDWEQEQRQREDNILEAFYTRPPAPVPAVRTARRPDATAAPITHRERDKFFRRVTKNENVLPSTRQNLLNILGAVLAAASATYMVLFADFNGHATGPRHENCFTPIRRYVFGPDSDNQREV